jgi:hypothetical protein
MLDRRKSTRISRSGRSEAVIENRETEQIQRFNDVLQAGLRGDTRHVLRIQVRCAKRIRQIV